jgi:hypothetical protein
LFFKGTLGVETGFPSEGSLPHLVIRFYFVQP